MSVIEVKTGVDPVIKKTLSYISEAHWQPGEEVVGSGGLMFGGTIVPSAEDLQKGPGVVSPSHALRSAEPSQN